MIAYVLFNKETPEERAAQDLVDRLEREDVEAELLDADSPRGIQFVENYDILGRPAVVLVRADGTAMQVWQGEDGLPAPSDVAYLVHQ
ncbi:MAG TPA: hypothetical protein VMS08_01520 [Candidatus Saccharimonadia bacterium]|nr:hypothetical protein [Candidatus Saccharimonadia bacterium]